MIIPRPASQYHDLIYTPLFYAAGGKYPAKTREDNVKVYEDEDEETTKMPRTCFGGSTPLQRKCP